MPIKNKCRVFFQSLFAKLMGGFIICLIVMSLLFFIAQRFYVSEKTHDVVQNTYLEFSQTVDTIDRYLTQMKYTFAEVTISGVMAPIVERRVIDGLDQTKMAETMRACVFSRTQNEFSPYLETLFFVTPLQNSTIVESSGSYLRDTFFSLHYINPKYSDSFWVAEMSKDFVFKTYPQGDFASVRNAVVSRHELVPMAYKLPTNNNFVMIALMDVKRLTRDILPENSHELIIYDASGTLIYPDSVAFDIANLEFGEQSHIRVNDGWLFRRATDTNTLTYYNFFPDSSLWNELSSLKVILFLAYFLALAIALAIAIFVASRYSRPIRQIAEELNRSELFEETIGCDLKSLRYVRDGIRFLLSQNSDYLSDLNQKDSLLKSIFLQSRMRDIYVSIDDVESKINISQSYIIIYMRVNYRTNFIETLNDEPSKATFFLKQLIELYLQNSGVDATSFQIENDQIVSVLNVNEGFESTNELIRNIIAKLENESEYAFFTIVVSDVHSDIANIKAVYDKMFELTKYARPTTETQVLFESEVKTGAGRFFFTVEQMEKFSATLQNGSVEESCRVFNEFLDYNIKKDVNGFDLYLLCTEIINCGVKLLNRLFHTTPQMLKVSDSYAALDHAVTLEQYQRICESFISSVADYIKINRREEDYIISFILDYVDEHYAEDIYLNLFAEKLKLTTSYISSYFKKKMNINLTDYINSFRIKKALILIENPQNKNKDIAAMVGMQNINTFIRLFKDYTGYTPGAYRKSKLGK